VTGFALYVLDILLVGVDVSIAHDLLARVTIHTVESILTFGELTDVLVKITKYQPKRLVFCVNFGSPDGIRIRGT